MALLFIYDRSQDTICEILGIDKTKYIKLQEKLFDMIKEDIDMSIDMSQGSENVPVTQSKLEYCQGLAEYLARDLTPELGLLIGILMADAETMTETIMTHYGMGKPNEQSN